ncbi:AMED_5909 family protein [Amycolatopsis sp. lyj-23]|uniref:AMED_5909 family protein n=1 Tax=Amycolatopsis sp. lyj-23 TaxID=2789283 RepID=UPI00397DF82F
MSRKAAKAAKPLYPVKLSDAQADIFSRMPRKESPLSEWVEFHRHNARMFKAVSETDPDHKWEALANHGIQLRCVERLTKRPEWSEDYTNGSSEPDSAETETGSANNGKGK